MGLYPGCGVSGIDPEGNPGRIADENANGDGVPGQQVVIPVSDNSSAVDTPNADADANADVDGIVDDFFSNNAPEQTVIGPAEFANFLTFLNDAFVTEILRGSPATGGFLSSQSHLERLCIDQGTPEFICRQRYGN